MEIALALFNILALSVSLNVNRKIQGTYFNFYSYNVTVFIVFFVLPLNFFMPDPVFVQFLILIFSVSVLAVLLFYKNKKILADDRKYSFGIPCAVGVKAAALLYVCSVAVFFYLVGFDLPLLSDNPEIMRGTYSADNSSALRIIKYFVPFLGIYLLYSFETKKTTLLNRILYLSLLVFTIGLMPFEGNKSTIFAFVLFLWFYYTTTGKSPKYISFKYWIILGLIGVYLITQIYIKDANIQEFLSYRFYHSTLEGLSQSVNYYTQENGFLYGRGFLNPILIFLSKIFSFEYLPTYTTTGNLMAKYVSGISGDYNFELLNTLVGDAYLDFGAIGIGVYAIIISCLYLYFIGKIKRCKRLEISIFYYFVSLSFVKMMFIGKFGSLITSEIFSYCFILFLFTVVRKILSGLGKHVGENGPV